MGGLGLFTRRRAIQSSLTRQSIAVMNWIQFNQQTIELDYFVNPNTEINIHCRLISNSNTTASSSANNRIFGVDEGSSYTYSVNHGGQYNEFNTLYAWTPKSYNAGGAIKNITISQLADTDINMGFRTNSGKYIFYVNSSQLITSGVPAITFPKPLSIGGPRETPYNRSNLRLYGIQIVESGTQVRNYVPVDIEGRTGLYDTITRVFLTSTDGSNFITG